MSYPDLPSISLLVQIDAVLNSDVDPARGVANLFDRRADFLVPLRAEHAELHAAALDQFADAFDALELAILLCRPFAKHIGALTHGDESEEGAGEWALAELLRSGILVAGDVLALMRAGYTTGALARWRALHEIATRAEFISGAGEFLLETARRYHRHEHYRSIRELKFWQGWYRKVDPSLALPRTIWKDWLAEAGRAVAEHGDVFRRDYGWAHAQLIATSPEYADLVERDKRPRGPEFDDLERVVRGRTEDARRWRFLYASANAAVHADSSDRRG